MAEFRHTHQLRPPTDYINSLSLVANVSERVPIPAGRFFVVFSCTSNYYVKVGDVTVSATVPGDVVDGTASELNPLSYVLHGNADWTHISVITSANAIATLAFYEVS